MPNVLACIFGGVGPERAGLTFTIDDLVEKVAAAFPELAAKVGERQSTLLVDTVNKLMMEREKVADIPTSMIYIFSSLLQVLCSSSSSNSSNSSSKVRKTSTSWSCSFKQVGDALKTQVGRLLMIVFADQVGNADMKELYEIVHKCAVQMPLFKSAMEKP